MINMRVGERIKARRKELGMTGEDLAAKLGCHATTIYRWERGDIEKVDSSMLLQVANALTTTPMALMGLDEKKPEEVPAPKTEEARIISEGVDRLPLDARRRALEIFRLAFNQYESEFGKDDENDT